MRDWMVPLLGKHLMAFDCPFEWGVRDCIKLTAGWIKIATGRDLITAGLSWEDSESALAAMLSLGCSNTQELATRFLPQSPSVLSARVGDIVGRNMGAIGFALGICDGPNVRFIDLKHGIVTFGLSRCTAAWMVD